MKRRDHPSAEAARRELTDQGYMPAHVPPAETRQLWIRKDGKGPTLAIVREKRARSMVWHIVESAPRVRRAEEQLDLLDPVTTIDNGRNVWGKKLDSAPGASSS